MARPAHEFTAEPKSEDPINYHRQTPGVYYDPIIAGKYKSDKYGLYFPDPLLLLQRILPPVFLYLGLLPNYPLALGQPSWL